MTHASLKLQPQVRSKTYIFSFQKSSVQLLSFLGFVKIVPFFAIVKVK